MRDYSYYNDIITIPCGNYGCDNNVFTTKHEYDINENDVFCLDCLTRYGLSENISINTLEILNNPNGVYKCINNFNHDVSILSDLKIFGNKCFLCGQ